MLVGEKLNERQKEAVDQTEGPVLILAGAGAGKTKTITWRIINLIKKGINPSNILGITFTNKAAEEMRQRVFRMIDDDKELNFPITPTEKPFLSTFHSLSVHILKENSKILGIPRHFAIYDRDDSKKAIRSAMEELNINPKEFEPAGFLSAISRQKSNFVTQENFMVGDSKSEFYFKLVKDVWKKYEATLEKEKALDFDDLLLRTAILLNKNEEIRKYYSEKWKYIHIDEYQDTNKVQYEIAKNLALNHKNICVVGDADQSIYSWRGADIQNILNFEKDYPSAKVILLEENYRSTKNILEAANKVIQKNVMRKDKNLFTQNDRGEKISIIETFTGEDEAREIADKIKKIINQGVSPKDISVLFRTNFQSRILEEAFLKKNLPYQVLGIKFFERKEIKDVLALLRLALNPEGSADLARVINVPPRGIGKVTLIKIMSKDIKSMTLPMQTKVSDFFEKVSKIKQLILEKKPSEAILSSVRLIELDKYLKDTNDLDALENIGELVSLSKKYDHLENGEGIEALLTDASLATDQDEIKEGEERVKLMTVHASKGLEFDYVFISGLEKDLFPHKRLDEDSLNLAEEEEERRLFYVALTRAKKKVFLTFARMRTVFGREKYPEPSQFIGELDGNLTEKEEIIEPTGVKAIFIDF